MITTQSPLTKATYSNVPHAMNFGIAGRTGLSSNTAIRKPQKNFKNCVYIGSGSEKLLTKYTIKTPLRPTHYEYFSPASGLFYWG